VIPNRVDILGKSYRVDLIERESGDYGECFSDQCRIEVATYQCEAQKRDTLLHEVLHAVDHEMNCRMSEAQIRRMATGLLAVFRHNPAFVASLTED
jgi:hypothetical protein